MPLGHTSTRKIPGHQTGRKKPGALTKKGEQASRKSPLVAIEHLGAYATADGKNLAYLPGRGFFQKGRQIAIKPGKLLPIMSPFFVTAENWLSQERVGRLLEINFETEKIVESIYRGKMDFRMIVKKIGSGRYEVIQCKPAPKQR